MSKLTIAEIQSPLFNQTLKKLTDSQLDVAKMLEFRKFMKKLMDEQKSVDETRMAIIKDYAKLDKDGNPEVNQETKSVIFESPEKQEDCTKKIEELFKQEIEAEFTLKSSELVKHELTTSDLMILEKIITE